MLREGMNERQIKDFMVERYGDFVLYDPPIKSTTLVLWAAPLLMVFIAFWFVVRTVRRRARSIDAHQSSEDTDRARDLLKD
jgi:cytochrome c-type biogenesis protein CcmH